MNISIHTEVEAEVKNVKIALRCSPASFIEVELLSAAQSLLV